MTFMTLSSDQKEVWLSRCGLLDHVLCKWWLVRHYFEWVWVILGGWGEWGCMGLFFGWGGVVGALFWVGGSG